MVRCPLLVCAARGGRVGSVGAGVPASSRTEALPIFISKFAYVFFRSQGRPRPDERIANRHDGAEPANPKGELVNARARREEIGSRAHNLARAAGGRGDAGGMDRLRR